MLHGSRLINDWESRYPSAEAWAPLEKRQQSRVAQRLMELSQAYGLASREMSLVAVVTRPGDRPGELPKTQVVSVGMAQDTKFKAYFRRQGGAGRAYASQTAAPSSVKSAHSVEFGFLGLGEDRPAFSRSLGKSFGSDRTSKVNMERYIPQPTAEDILLDLASRMDSDGGMPGENPESRAIATIVVLLAFLSQGHTPTGGVFRSHMARLVSFLNSLTGLSSHHQKTLAEVVEWAGKGKAPAGEWLEMARTSGDQWTQVENSLSK